MTTAHNAETVGFFGVKLSAGTREGLIALVAAALDDEADVWQLARMAVQALEDGGYTINTEALAERAEKAETALAHAYERIDTWRATCEQRIEDADLLTVENERLREMVDGMHHYADCQDQYDRLEAAILDIDAHATALGEDDQGFVAGGYIITVGSLHRALGVVGHPAARCLRCTPANHDCGEAQHERDRREGHVSSDLPIIRNPLHHEGGGAHV